MTLRRQLRLLTLATYTTLALTALAFALILMSAAQALGIQPWTAAGWWTAILPDAGGTAFLITFAGASQAIIQYFRERVVWRLAALAGNDEALPPAAPALVLGRAENASAPLATVSLRWGLTNRGRMVRILPWSIYSLILTGIAALLLWLQLALTGPSMTLGDPFNLIVPAVAVSLICVSLLVLGLALRAGLRRPVGVSADSAGISRWTRRGPSETLLWSDARLIEARWMAANRKTPWPFIRVYRADETSIGWPIFPEPGSDEKWRYEPVEMSEGDAARSGRALLRLASANSRLPVRTADRSLIDAGYKWGQDVITLAQALPGRLYMILVLVALGVGALAFRWPVAPWLSVAATLGLGLCAARLAYFYAGSALAIPPTWAERDREAPSRHRLFWPAIMTVGCAGALVTSTAGVLTGHAPSSIWIDIQVVGGAAILMVTGALIFWARSSRRERASATSMRA